MTSIGNSTAASATEAQSNGLGHAASLSGLAKFTTHRVQTAQGVNLFVRESGKGKPLSCSTGGRSMGSCGTKLRLH